MRSPAWTWDELMLACALVVKNGWRELRTGDAAVLELSELLRSLPLHEGVAAELPSYRSVGSVSRKTTDLATNHPAYRGKATKGGSMDHAVVRAFIEHEEEMLIAARAVEEGISSGELALIAPQPDEVADDGLTALEGRLLARWALSRERSTKLRRRKIDDVLRRGRPLECEVCRFNFGLQYGRLGEGYIEIHHTLPLHISGPRETRIGDLALLCANCHRMCHTSFGGTSWRTPAALMTEIARLSQPSARSPVP
ncbi:HNH endonuclease [Streptomyces sp. Tu 2975]|uniref:HNH endonuclease n=1 Tax=Streptomyces sp. Tu 2975 TaxID=2676871 RepID=UPI00135C18B2|nr:HNH endonuclease [Streptomyces sp. Tu 2975]QIP86322.1 HNH endonuclease [Streptomyces sp. Tu 2975]